MRELRWEGGDDQGEGRGGVLRVVAQAGGNLLDRIVAFHSTSYWAFLHPVPLSASVADQAYDSLATRANRVARSGAGNDGAACAAVDPVVPAHVTSASASMAARSLPIIAVIVEPPFAADYRMGNDTSTQNNPAAVRGAGAHQAGTGSSGGGRAQRASAQSVAIYGTIDP